MRSLAAVLSMSSVISFGVVIGIGSRAAPTEAVDSLGDPLPKGAIARLGSARFRHDAAIVCQAASPDGKWLASGGGRTIRLWDAATGKQVLMLPMTSGPRFMLANALAFSPDSKSLGALSAVNQAVVTIWDMPGGQPRHQISLPQRDDNVGGGRLGLPEDMPLFAFTADGRGVLVKNYGDRVVRQFDLESGQEVRTYQDPGNLLTSVVGSPDRALLAAGSDSRHVLIWDVATGKELRRLPHDYPLVSLAFSPDSRTLVSMDQDLSPALWNVKTGVKQLELPARTRSVDLTFSEDGQTLLVARQPDEILSWNLRSKQEHRLRVPRNWVTPTASWLALPPAAGGEGKARLLLGSTNRRATSAKLRVLELGRDGPTLPPFDGYENGSLFPFYLPALKQWATIAATGDDTVRLWDSQGRVARAFRLPIGDPVLQTFAVAPDGRRFCLGARDGHLYVVNGGTGELLHQIQAFQRPCTDSSITADGRFLLATDLRRVKVFDLASGTEVRSYELHKFDCMRALLSADGSRVAAMVYNPDDEQPLMRLFDAVTGKVLYETRSTVQQSTFYFSADGRNVIFINNNRGRGGHVQVMEVASGKTRMTGDLPLPYQYAGNHVRISPDGRWLVAMASGPEAEQYAAVAWQLGVKAEPVVLTGHRGALVSVHYDSASKHLLTLSADSTMLLWDLTRFAKPATPYRLEVKDQQKVWAELRDPDAARALAVIHQLAAQPQTVPWLAERLLKQVVMPDPDQVRELIEKLDSAKFNEREKATEQLTQLGNTATPALREALNSGVSAEVRRRLQGILEKSHEAGGLDGLSLQAIRGIETLEIMGTTKALQALRQVGTRTDSLGAEARAAALRLAQRVAG